MQDTLATVVANQALPLPYCCTTFVASDELMSTQPGQFVMIGAPDRLQPFLPRAYSVFDLTDQEQNRASILAKVIGPGTRWLSELRPGDQLRVLGPLGNGFRHLPERRAALVAGGVGSAALLLLAKQFAVQGVSFDFFYGGRQAQDLAAGELFEQSAQCASGNYYTSTEDGSCGHAGLITELLEQQLEQQPYDAIYTCGPLGLMAAVDRISAQREIVCEAALETVMGCGYGACLGCALETTAGSFALCCKDGPVFRSSKVAWKALL